MRVDKSKINMELVNELQKYILKNKSVVNIACYEYTDHRLVNFLGFELDKKEVKQHFRKVKQDSLRCVGGERIGRYGVTHFATVSKYLDETEDYASNVNVALVELIGWIKKCFKLYGEVGSEAYGRTEKARSGGRCSLCMVNDSLKYWNTDWDNLSTKSILYDFLFYIVSYLKSRWKHV
jgi:hypothetical protein